MIEKSCKCGDSKKRFHIDIGPFFVGECCEAKGYDALGNKSEVVAEYKMEHVGEGAAVVTEVIVGDTIEVGQVIPALSKGKLKDMNVQALKELAKSRGLENIDGLSKKQLIEALLK